MDGFDFEKISILKVLKLVSIIDLALTPKYICLINFHFFLLDQEESKLF